MITNRAPSEFLTILQNKVSQYKNGEYVDISQFAACTQFDFTNKEFTEHPEWERKIMTSDGRIHDRDALSAFNIKFAKREKVEGKKRIDKDYKNFDIDGMNAFYDRFCEMEAKMNDTV